MNDSLRGPDSYDPELVPWGTLFDPREAEQQQSQETRDAGAVVRQRGGFVAVLMHALSAWPA